MAKPLLPPLLPQPKGGRPPVPHRAALTGILFVLKTGLPWEYLPAEMGCGSGMTCWRRLHAWQQAGIWDALHRVLLERHVLLIAGLYLATAVTGVWRSFRAAQYSQASHNALHCR